MTTSSIHCLSSSVAKLAELIGYLGSFSSFHVGCLLKWSEEEWKRSLYLRRRLIRWRFLAHASDGLSVSTSVSSSSSSIIICKAHCESSIAIWYHFLLQLLLGLCWWFSLPLAIRFRSENSQWWKSHLWVCDQGFCLCIGWKVGRFWNMVRADLEVSLIAVLGILNFSNLDLAFRASLMGSFTCCLPT